MLCLRTSPRRWQEHLSGKLKEHGFFQDERDPCFLMNADLENCCFGVHVDDVLAVGPCEVTKKLLEALAKDVTMRWCIVSDKPQDVLVRSLCRRSQGYRFGVTHEYVTQLCKDFGFWQSQGFQHTPSRKLLNVIPFWTKLDNAVTDSCLEGYSGWIVRISKNAVCQLSTHVGTATNS